jgi:hypothetical protein
MNSERCAQRTAYSVDNKGVGQGVLTGENRRTAGSLRGYRAAAPLGLAVPRALCPAYMIFHRSPTTPPPPL